MQSVINAACIEDGGVTEVVIGFERIWVGTPELQLNLYGLCAQCLVGEMGFCTEVKRTPIKRTPYIARIKANPSENIRDRSWYTNISELSECNIPLLPSNAYLNSE